MNNVPSRREFLESIGALGAASLLAGSVGTTASHAAEGDKHAEHAGEKKDEHAEGAEELTLTAEEAERAGVKVWQTQ